jgi:predicted phosphodiesterase
MRILAISDIHNNVACVRKLRAQEGNDYDVIALPGDIGTHRAAEIFATLKSFGCPIVYIHGNWDRTEDVGFDRTARLVHLRVVKVGRFAFTGYSFDGPVPEGVRGNAGYAEYTRSCRAVVRDATRVAGVELARCILLAHDRATHLDREFPGLLLHLYGHVHTFDVRERAGTTFVNTSALDRMLPVASKRDRRKVRYANAGNYAVIEVDRTDKVSVECRLLRRNWQSWRVIGSRSTFNGTMGGELIPEDAVFGDNIRSRRLRPHDCI